jgi:hypothetical protein
MTTLRLKKTNGVPPRAAKIEGTNQKYGLDRNWRAVSRSPVPGTDEYAFTLDDGILETIDGDSRKYYSVRSDRMAKLDGIVPRSIRDYMSEKRCSRDDAWTQIYEALRQAHACALSRAISPQLRPPFQPQQALGAAVPREKHVAMFAAAAPNVTHSKDVATHVPSY